MKPNRLIDLDMTGEPTQLDAARTRRALQNILDEARSRSADGAEPRCDIDPRDPLVVSAEPWKVVQRSAELQKRGSIVWLPDQLPLDWSPEMCRLVGLAPAEARLSVGDLFAMIHPSDRRGVVRSIINAMRRRAAIEIVCRVRRHDGSTSHLHCDLEVATNELDQVVAVVATVHDVTATALRQKETRRLALREQTLLADVAEADPDTGLLTRRAFTDMVGLALAGGTGTLLVFSAPPFIRRHADANAGQDATLARATAEMIRSVWPTDPAAVLGRHEYGVVMPYSSVATAVPKVRGLLDRLRRTPFLAASAELEAFGGLVAYDSAQPVDSIDLLYDAENAWRQAKQENRPLVVMDPLPSPEERRQRCRADIRSAVERDRFALYAQPIRDLELNRTTRYEILLRVLDEVGRPVPPETYLRRAERLDEIVAVDRWVIEHALPMIGHAAETSHYQINISGRSIGDPLLLNHLVAAVDRYGVDAERLTLEITETAKIDNIAVARRFAEGARELGCQIALDDFGTGNTPLSFLTQLPVDLVKIDGSFIRDLPESASSQVIVQSMVQICRRLGILTAAEYVQDDATLELLSVYGIDFAQGYHVGQPERVNPTPSRRNPVDMVLSPWETPKRTAM